MGAEHDRTKRTPNRPIEPRLQAVSKLIKDITYEDVLIFSTNLHHNGLMRRLEEAQVIPVADDPNPFDWELEAEQHEKWWNAHPLEGEAFATNMELRLRILKGLYVGVLLGSLIPEKVLPQTTARKPNP